MQRIGVFVCHCGTNIAATVDVKKVVDVISKEPGADNHFICGIIKHGNLLLINPLGITTHKTCYQTLAELQTEKTLQTVWMSSTPVQRHVYEEEGRFQPQEV